MTQKRKNYIFQKKKRIASIFQYFEILIGMHVTIYRSNLASQRSRSSNLNLNFKNEDNVREEFKIATSCRSNETERN